MVYKRILILILILNILFIFVCMCIYIYIYTHTYIHTHIHKTRRHITHDMYDLHFARRYGGAVCPFSQTRVGDQRHKGLNKPPRDFLRLLRNAIPSPHI